MHRELVDPAQRVASVLGRLGVTQLDLERERAGRQESERLFSLVLGAMSDAMLLVDPRGRIARVNRAAVELFGRTRDELVGADPHDILAPGVPASPWEISSHAREGVTSAEAVIERPGADRIEATLSFAVIEDAHGKVVGAIYTARDVTEERRAERHRDVQLAVTRGLAAAPTLEEAADAILGPFAASLGYEFGRLWLSAEAGGSLRCIGAWSGEGDSAAVRAAWLEMVYPPGDGLVARVLQQGSASWLETGAASGGPPYDGVVPAGLATLALPIEGDSGPLGVIELMGRSHQRPDPGLIELGTMIGAQVGRFIERKRGEDALSRVELIRTAFDSAPVGMALFAVEEERRGELIQVNEALRSFVGRTEEELLGSKLHDLINVDELDSHFALLRKLVADELPTFALETRCTHAQGHTVWGLMHCSLLRASSGQALYGIAQIQDITELKRAEAQLAHQALHDPLTRLPNRALLMDRLRQSLVRVGRTGGYIAVMFFDLDNFKVINDSLGHDVGDRLLMAVASRVQTALRESDTVARFGGDEFVVICEHVSDEGEALAAARRISDSLADPVFIEGREVFVTASSGIVLADGGSRHRPETLLRDADAAMYAAKADGRKRHVVFREAMRLRAVKRLELEDELRRAIDLGDLSLHYQPLVRLDSGAIFGCEALVRWNLPGRGTLPAGEFIPLAEETGLIEPLGDWVLEQACGQLQRWRLAYPDRPLLTMTVNVSSVQMGSRLAETVERVILKTGIDPDALWLEITETAVIEHVDAAAETMTALKALGVGIAIDDFGIGHSSLGRLRQLPAVDAIKIDRSFVSGLGGGSADVAIVGAAIELARALGARALAEGVESEEQVDVLRGLNCELAQGYYYGRPQPSSEFQRFMGSSIEVTRRAGT